MAEMNLEIAGRHYMLSCRDGEEAHLARLAAIVDEKAQDAARTMGGLGEARQLLLAALLLADEVIDARKGKGAPAAPAPPAPSAEPVADPALATALERLAERMEALAGRVETAASNA